MPGDGDIDYDVLVHNSEGPIGAANPLAVFAGGELVTVSAEFTRPGDATQYTALDVVTDAVGSPNYLTFANVTEAFGGSGYLTKALAMTDLKTATARFRLHLFHTPPSAIADNSPYLLLYANRAKRVGYIDLPAFATEDSSNSTAAYASVLDLRLPFVCAAASHDLYGVVESLSTWTPANAQKFYFELTVDRN